MNHPNAAVIRGAAGALCVAALLAIGTSAHADRAAGDACAAKLSGDAKTIYSATVTQVAGGGDVRSVITDTTRSLAMSGKIDRGAARGNAEAAGQCLAQVKS